jgi:uncharacterized protein YkwD
MCWKVAAGWLVIAVLLAGGAGPARAACGGRQATRADALPAARHAVRCLLNEARVRRGLPRLRGNPRLARAATRHAEQMVSRGFFGHDGPRGDTLQRRARTAGYLRRAGAWALAENIAWGTRRSSSPRAIVRAWIASPGHRANLLSRVYRDVGVGVAMGSPFGGPGATYTTDFGRRSHRHRLR